MRTVFLQSNKDSRDRVDYEDEYARRGKISYWTPTLTFATPGDLAVTYSTRAGEYSRSGNLIEASFFIVTSAYSFTTASGNLQITGIPFTASTLSSDSGMRWVGNWNGSGITKAGYTQFVPTITAGSNVIGIVASGSGQSNVFLTASDVPSGASVILNGTLIFRIR